MNRTQAVRPRQGKAIQQRQGEGAKHRGDERRNRGRSGLRDGEDERELRNFWRPGMAHELHLRDADRGGMSGATPEPRTAVMILVEATWEDQTGTVQSAPARMENRSAHGACIRLKTRIAVGARLSIQSHREQFSGVAKYCRSDGKDFLVGMQKDAVHRPLVKNPEDTAVPKRDAPRPKEAPVAKRVVKRRAEERAQAVSIANGVRIETPIAERFIVQEVRGRESPRRVEASKPPPASELTAPQPERPRTSEGKPATKGRKFMKLKWFTGNEEELLGTNGNGATANEPVQRAAETAPRAELRAAPASSAAVEKSGGIHSELLAMEDIYRAAGITSPRRGYSITKVVDMLRSEHMSGLSKEMRRAAVLMALDAAGVSAEEVLQDAKMRHEAIEAYAAEQRKHAEAQWARKAEENLQIQAELEQVKALYSERIRRNLDGVAREKATFGSWLKMKEQETQGMAEAVEQVLKEPTVTEPAGDPLLSVTPASVTGKPV